MIICRPCLPLVAVCPSDFSGGTVITPKPTRTTVCNVAQTAACDDGTNPQTVAAGVFCQTILNPTPATIASAQAQVNAQALAQAKSQVGDCAWQNLVWTCEPFDVAGTPVGVITGCSGTAGDFAVSAFSPNQSHANTGTRGVHLQGKITFGYKPGVITHHNISGTVINSVTGPSGLGARRSELELFDGPNFGALVSLFFETHDNVPGLGTFHFSQDFTNDGNTPRVYQIDVYTSVYCEEPVDSTPITHTQSIVGQVKALD